MTTMPTQTEILERIEARKADDMFGFEVSEYLNGLDYDHARPFLKEGVSQEEWDKARCASRDAVIERMRDYMAFAFGKANDQRGLSANRSIMHFIAWTWLAGDRELSDSIDHEYETDYRYYGKPILRRICEHYGWDWKQWDDGELTNGE